MSRQYGAPKEDPRQQGPGYSDRRKDAEPKPKEPDPSPSAEVVRRFHKNADTNKSRESMHHTIGPSQTQAASGSHNHRDGESALLFEGMTLTGAKGGNVALANLITILVQFGLKDSTSA